MVQSPKEGGGAKKTRIKTADAMDDDAKPEKKRNLYWETCAKTRDATPFEKCTQAQDKKAFQGSSPSSANTLTVTLR